MDMGGPRVATGFISHDGSFGCISLANLMQKSSEARNTMWIVIISIADRELCFDKICASFVGISPRKVSAV